MQKDPAEKIAFTLLAKYNEPADIIRRCISSVAPFVDGVFLTITKDSPESDTSELEKVASEFNAKVSYYDWVDDFSMARNYALEQIPKEEYGWFYWQDADDILQNADKLPEILHEAILNSWSAVFFSYWYAVDLDKNGNVREVVIEHKRERILRHDGTYKWVGKIHETLIEQKPSTKVLKNECIVVHLSDNKRLEVSLDRNIRILEKALKLENRKDPRTVMYLAKAYFDRAKFRETENDKKIDFGLAKALFLEYLQGAGTPGQEGYQESSGWEEERSSAWAYLADTFRLEGQYNQSIKCSLNAIAESNQFPGYYLDLAMTYVLMNKFDKADIWLRIGLNIPLPQTTLITNPRDLKARALEVDYHIAIAKQDLDRAFKASEGLKKVLPDIEAVEERLKVVGKLREANHAAQSLVYLSRYLEASGEPQKISDLIKAIPTNLEQERFYSEMKNKYLPPRIWDKDEVAIFCGPGFEKWSPKNIKDGIGGSEEAVIYLSKELHKLGYKVTVFADPRDDRGVYEGVTYVPFHEINIKDNFNIMIFWRQIASVDANITANKTYVWLHDVPTNPEFTEERVAKVDKIFVLSDYHKSLLRMNRKGEMIPMPEDKVFVTSNGINKPAINKKWARKKHSMIWTSSYDRGLPYLLNMWPDIKKEIPDATLDIYYGWNLYDVVHANNPARAQWKNQVEQMMKQDGVTHHGRVGHSELAKALSQAEVWTYPTDFQEISCISAMKAQGHGAFPVVTNYAALKETVQSGKKIDVDMTTKDGQETYKQELIKFLKEDSENEEKRKEMMKNAEDKFLWSVVARQWEKLFSEKVSTTSPTVIDAGKEMIKDGTV
jgi:glycosyltransferase involved in cell wall biosynthesis/tetratricopeptide (TPR) repeat protein